MNAKVKQGEQLTQAKKGKLVSFNFGPAKGHRGDAPLKSTELNEIYLAPVDAENLRYTVMHKDLKKIFKSGTMKIGDVVSTGWMGLELRLLDYLPKAREEYEVFRL